MDGMFSGLEGFGIKNLNKVDLYEDNKKNKTVDVTTVSKITEADVLFDKTYSCPCCYAEFTSKTIRTGKIKPLAADSDLRPKYQLVDTLKYDAVVCPTCGYAALSRFFNFITSTQSKWIHEQISSSFVGIENKGDIYTYDEAIMRHKLALLNTVVKKGRNSEKAYTCLKLAWLCRGKAESITDGKEKCGSPDTVTKSLKKEELDYLKFAYEGFSTAFAKENFPMCGMDSPTTMYLLSELARRIGDYDSAGQWISRVLTSRDAKKRIKDKAIDLKQIIQESKRNRN